MVRVEDDRLLRGQGKFTDDFNFSFSAKCYFLRSPIAFGKIISINYLDALKTSGVYGVFTYEDVKNDLKTIPNFANFTKKNGSPMFVPPRTILANERVFYVGEPIVLIIAETIDIAKDASEKIYIDFEELKPIVSIRDAVKKETNSIWPECKDNISFTFSLGDKSKTDKVFNSAAHVFEIEYSISRVYAAPMEPRAVLGTYDNSLNRFTVYTGTQSPHNLKRILARNIFCIPENSIRVISPDMGGAFGMRASVYPEIALVLWASKKLGKPIKWKGERSEGFISDDHGRDNFTKVSLALDSNHKFIGLKVNTLAALGAYISTGGSSPPTANLGGLAGVYTTPDIFVNVDGVFTNTIPTAAYRGAGRPEASFAIERIIDEAAYKLGVDPIELRKKNTILSDSFPYQTGLVFKYDSGNFLDNLEKCLINADIKNYSKRLNLSKLSGKLRGFGIANVVERSAAMGEETAELRIDSSGSITFLMGTHSHGQGHETIYKNLITKILGIDHDNMIFIQGDTDIIPHGFGTFGSRSSSLGTSALSLVCQKILKKAKQIASYKLEVQVDDLEVETNTLKVKGTDRKIHWSEIANLAYDTKFLPINCEPGLNERSIYVPSSPTFPNGCHCVELEIEQETGRIQIINYTVVDDVGKVLNPILLDGQIHGGLVQGIGQVLMEQIIYDKSNGQLITGSFMDYSMPKASDLPFFDVSSNPSFTSVNPMGVKGAGEAGTVGALPAVVNAIYNALLPFKIRKIEMPITSEAIWRAIKNSQL